MKVGIKQKALMEILDKGSLAAITEEVQSSNAIHSLLARCIKITANKNLIIESSTELLSVKTTIPITGDNGIVVKEEGCILIPAKELIHWAKVQGPESTITLSLSKFDTPDIINTYEGDAAEEQDMSKYVIRKIGTVKLLSKNDNKTSGKWELDCFDPDQSISTNYDVSSEKRFEIQGGMLIESLANVIFAAKDKDEQHVLDSISIQTYKDDTYFATTDKIRCALYQIPKETISNAINKPLLVLASTLEQISKIIDKDSKVVFSYNEEIQKIFISQANLNIRIVSTDKDQMDKFANISSLLVKEYAPLVEIPKNILNELLVSASVVNSSCALFIFNKADSTFTVKAISEENKYKPSIKQSILPAIAKDAKVVLGIKHVMDALKVTKNDNVIISIPENMKSVKITGKDNTNFHYYIVAIENNPHYRDA